MENLPLNKQDFIPLGGTCRGRRDPGRKAHDLLAGCLATFLQK